MYLSQMPNNYDTYWANIRHLWDWYYLKLLRKSRKKIKDLHQIWENEEGEWFYAVLYCLASHQYLALYV